MSSISATINGSARLVERGTEEEKYYSEIHLENNTFDSAAGELGEGRDGDRSRLAGGNDARVIVVGIKDVRISDWKGNVRDWVIVQPGTEVASERDQRVNGIR